MISLIYEYEIPDPSRPIPGAESGFGPSGELIAFVPKPLDAAQVVGREIDEVCPHVGTYGMGGPGFFGLKLGSDWLVVAIWGAAEWIHADGLLVQGSFYDNYDRPVPWISESGDKLSPKDRWAENCFDQRRAP